jgi:LysM repeat protein
MIHIPAEATTASAVAALYGMTAEEVKKINGLTSDNIAALQPVRVNKTGASVVSAEAKALSKIENESFPEVPNAERIHDDATAMPTTNGEYEVRGGQTLFTIAALYGTTTEAIKTQNNLTSDAVEPGTKIVVTSGAKKASRYQVKKGDSLKSIAAKTGVSVSKLKEINHLEFYTLHEGMQLRTK